MRPPEIEDSTREEREKYILTAFACRGDCESCGFCAMYRGRSPEVVYDDYIEGIRSFQEITQDYR
ncbi:MAG: hypothetical protein MR867_01800 [Eubacterium sp.]|nr:hypothetical protein [Eubacterium sp.]MDD7209057.1 hypothetical protein [Lachnospiraceae bacterium]MDY5496429.1 hypothetical protein [Anaerobutyricum sp.]